MNTTNTLVRSYNEEKLGQRIKYIREKMNFSRKEIGDLLQVSYQQIQKYETGKNRISAMSLKKMSMIFDIPVDTFFIDDHDYSQLVQTAIENQSIDKVWKKLPNKSFKLWIGLALKEIANDCYLE